MRQIVNSIPLLYLALLWPGRLTIWDLFARDWYYPQMMYDSGIWSIRLLILTVAVTPTLLAINRLGHGVAFGRWLLPRRRHFGLASAIFAAVHLAHYVFYTWDIQVIWTEAIDVEFLVGWLSLMIFAILAVTSNRWSIRKLGRRWKPMHMMVYAAGAFAFLHWYLFDFFTGRVLFWAALFCLPKLIQIALRHSRLTSKTNESA